MISIGTLFAVAVFVTVALAALPVLRPELTRGRGGRVLAFFALFIFPALLTAGGLTVHMEQAKSTEFCLSCHVMEPYGESLWTEDASFLAASHFQNRRVAQDSACYTCHTDYTMFGDVSAKWRGLRHVWVQVLGDPPPPEEIELYSSYNNRECLHCHGGARAYVENELHAEVLGELASGELSCLECHGPVHEVADVAERERWTPAGAPAGEGIDAEGEGIDEEDEADGEGGGDE